MQLDDYLRVVLRRWYVPVILLAMALAGARLYTHTSATSTADASVSIPIKSYIDFDNVVNGRALAERVAAKLADGSTPEQIDGSIAGNIKKGDRLIPLYQINATASDANRATLLANTATQEALGLFSESKKARLDYIKTSFEAQRNQAAAQAATAQDDLDRFLAQNNAFALPTRIAQQADLVAKLRVQDQIGANSFELTPSDSELTAAQQELDRLLGLDPEWNKQQLAVTLAQNDIDSLQAELNTLQLGGSGYQAAITSVSQELADAKDRLTAAQQALATFQTTNGVSDLTAATSDQQGKVNDILLARATLDGHETLAEAESALTALQTLQPEYNRLAAALSSAQKALAIRDQQQLFVLLQTSPVEDQVEVVEPTQLKSAVWWMAIRYAAAVFLAAFLSSVIVFVLFFFEKYPPSIEELEREFGRPVIGRVPKHPGRSAR